MKANRHCNSSFINQHRIILLNVAYNFALGTEKSVTFHSLIVTVSCDVCKYSFLGSVGSTVTNSESTKITANYY